MAERTGMRADSAVLTNVRIAGAAVCLLSAIIIFPGLFAAPAARLKSRQKKAERAINESSDN